MSSDHSSNVKFEIGHVLFIDIVGYSKLLISEQSEQIQELKQIARGTQQVRLAEAEGKLLRPPTGDGGALVFRNNPEAPVLCALEIGKALKTYPEVKVRMAQRVMDCGDAGHILLSKRVSDDLEQYPRWRPLFHDLGECGVKHGVRVGVVNLYNNEVGNPKAPKKFQTVQQHRTRKRLAAIVIALLLLSAIAVAFIIVSKKSGVSPVPVAEKSVAVLPFENLSDDKANAYFAAGIQDEILTRLSDLHDLKVISRTSTEKYQSHPPNLKVIAAELGVAHILEGSVQKLANSVHINVQLIHAATDAHVWAQSYDRSMDHAFAVEGEIATTVADALRVALLAAQIEKLNSVPTNNTQAYDAYLKGEYALNQAWKNPGDYQKTFEPAISKLREAAELDPKFALAYARLADAELTKYYFGYVDGGAVRMPELLVGAKQNLDRALQLQPDLADAHVGLGRWHSIANKDDNAALAEYQRALAINPRISDAMLYSAGTALRQGNPTKAIELLSKALEFDPRNFRLLRNLAVA